MSCRARLLEWATVAVGSRVRRSRDNHTPATARTNIRRFVFVTTVSTIALSVRRSWVGCAEESTGQCNVVGPVGIGEKAVVTDAVKSVGQHMDQEAADERVDIERHEPVAGVELGAVILPFESHAFAVTGDEPAIGDSDPVSVAGQVGEHSVGSAKRPLGIDHPFELPQCSDVGFERCRLDQGGLVGEELQPPGLVGGGQPFQEQAAEEA